MSNHVSPRNSRAKSLTPPDLATSRDLGGGPLVVRLPFFDLSQYHPMSYSLSPWKLEGGPVALALPSP